MSSQILVYGYIELARGSEEQSVVQLRGIRERSRGSRFCLATSLAGTLEGWPSSTVSFARTFKKEGDSDCEILRSEFEEILRNLDAISAHLSIEDEEGVGEQHIDYSYGPARFGGPNVWTSVVSRRLPTQREELSF